MLKRTFTDTVEQVIQKIEKEIEVTIPEVGESVFWYDAYRGRSVKITTVSTGVRTVKTAKFLVAIVTDNSFSQKFVDLHDIHSARERDYKWIWHILSNAKDSDLRQIDRQTFNKHFKAMLRRFIETDKQYDNPNTDAQPTRSED